MITFTTQDLQVLKSEKDCPNNSDIWKKAVDYYNQENDKKISVSCMRPGYFIVLKFIENKLSE